MTLLTPLLAGIVAAIAIPSLVILYFLKLRRRDLEISTTLLWKKAIQDLQANAPFQKLRRNILLILQLLALAAAIFALAQPEFRAETSLGQRSVILIDRSASMNASDGAPKDGPERRSRLEAAKEKAIELIDALREPGLFSQQKGDEAMVIAFDSEAIVRQSFTTDKALLRAAVNAIEPSDAPTSVEQAFKLAKAYTGSQKFEDQVQENRGFVPASPGATIHVISDGRIPDAAGVATALEDTILYHRVGRSDATNIGIVGLQAQRSFTDPSQLTIYIGLASTAHEKTSVDVQFAIDGQVQRVRSVTLPAATPPEGLGATVAPKPADARAGAGSPADAAEGEEDVQWRPGIGGVTFSLDRTEGGIVTVELRNIDADALAADNVGYLVFPPAKRLAVALVTPDGKSFFVRTVLEGLTLSKLDILPLAQYEARLRSGSASEYDIAIFENCAPAVQVEGSAAPVPGLPPGRSIVMGAVPNIRGAPRSDGTPAPGLIDEGDSEQAIIVSWNRDHPAIKHAALDSLIIPKSRKVTLGVDAPARAIATTQVGPAIIEVTDGSTRSIIVPFNPARTNWPLDPGYILFIVESMYYLTDTGVDTRQVKPGDTLAEILPGGAKDVRLSLPDNARVDLVPAPDGSVSYKPVRDIGIHTLSWIGASRATDEIVDGRVRRPIAANLLDPAESDIPAASNLAMAREIVKGETDGTAKKRRQLWPWVLLAALGVIMLEWFVYNKKVHI
ncbi:MAG: VWA domain-containing protein [Phycisphaerales bacterium]